MLEVKHLKVHFHTYEGIVEAVDSIGFTIGQDEILGLVGESGSGKSVTALSIMRLIDEPGRIVDGEIWFEGQDLLSLSEEKMRRVRGRRVSMIFQNARASLNPVKRIGDQIARVYQVQHGLDARRARVRAVESLQRLGMPDAEEKMTAYPHQLSGGMCQRAHTAMMLASSPGLLIADEPTTALDATIAAQLLRLLKDLQREHGSSLLYITHDMGVIAKLCDRVAVMHAGHIVEVANVATIFAKPLHPYTRALLQAILRVDRDLRLQDIERIPGAIPSLLNPPAGCRFASRCGHVLDTCTRAKPPLWEVESGHLVLCQEAVIHGFMDSDRQGPNQVLPFERAPGDPGRAGKFPRPTARPGS